MFTKKTLGCSSVWSEVHKNYSKMKNHVSDTWLTRVTCLESPPLNSWWNSDLFTCKTLGSSSVWSEVQKHYTKRKNTCQSRDGHVSRVWDHHHWIPGEILTCLHVRHLDIAQNQMLVLFFPIFTSKLVKNANCAPKGLTKILRSLLYTNMTLTKP